eukprot:gene7592-2398_t
MPERTDRNNGVVFTPTSEMWKEMADDQTRVGACAAGIGAVAKGKVVLDIGTGPYAVLAILAAEAGAQRVYAVEQDPDAARVAIVIKRGDGVRNS